MFLSRKGEKRVAKEGTPVVVGPLVSSDGPRGAGVPAPLFIREIGVEIPGPRTAMKTHDYSGECWKVEEAEMIVKKER
jgi:hypothetical protein